MTTIIALGAERMGMSQISLQDCLNCHSMMQQKKLSSDFGLNLIKQESCCHIHQTVNPEIVYRNWLHSAERILNDYLNMLCRWQKQYAPKSPNEPLHPNFVESLTNMDYYNYLYELVRYGDEADKRSLYTTEKKKSMNLKSA